ncbi:hypothetical protein [Kurthia senegalensis]|uniref:hypothetical protein n=1 Tax=Kurthia senegalensis TaxID=1033740 RepID=UPI0002898ACF|nr:hypothetical protein [Kurthia senegalensis]
MKKKRWIMIILMIVLGIAAFTSLQQNKNAEQDVEKIINERDQIDQIIVKQEDQTIQKIVGVQSVKQYVEETPLAKIENLERSTKKKFVKKPQWTIDYKIGNRVLYSVDVFQLKKEEALSTEENDYIFSIGQQSYMLVWQPYEERLSQNERTLQLLENSVK